MRVCALCQKEIEVGRDFSRKDSCPHCGGDLHICLNCRFYSEKSHNKCLEPSAEFQRTRDRANHCEYFSFREGGLSNGKGGIDLKEETKRRFEGLFKKRS